MSTEQKASGIWADKGEMSNSNPRYLHAKLLSGSGYTPEPVNPPPDWFEQHGTDVYPIERIEGDDWNLLEQSEDLGPASQIQIAIEIVKGFQHLRDTKRAIIWDTKPEHILIHGFCPPDDVSHITVKFVDLETVFLVDRNEFSTSGNPTLFTTNSIARQEDMLLQSGIFDPEAEVIESLISYIRAFNEASEYSSPVIDQELVDYWGTTFNCNFDNFLDCLQRTLDRIIGQDTTLRTQE